MLRTTLIILAALAFLVALGLLSTGNVSLSTALIWVAIDALVLLLALLFERGRYQPPTSDGPWTPTGERFLDPTTNHWVEVQFNPRTGERRYVEAR